MLSYPMPDMYHTRKHIIEAVQVVKHGDLQYVEPWIVQAARHTDCAGAVTVARRFSPQGHDAREFHSGLLERRLIELRNAGVVLDLEVSGVQVRAVYNPHAYNDAGVGYVLNGLHTGRYKLCAPCDLSLIDQVADTWFELQAGLIWTVSSEACSIIKHAIDTSGAHHAHAAVDALSIHLKGSN